MFHHGNPVMAIISSLTAAQYDLPKDLPSACAPSCAHVSPMLYKTLRAAVYGIDANIIEVEVSAVKTGQDYFHTVGLPDAAVRESRDRVRAALKNAGSGGDWRLSNIAAIIPSIQFIREFCELPADCERLLERAMAQQGRSTRAHDRILNVARTIVDLDGVPQLEPKHIAEAIPYQTLDRTYWT
jgi:predicted ATPase with chaperone activity